MTQRADIKVIMIGDIGVGKTSIIRRYINGYFQANYKATIGVDFCSKSVVLPESKRHVNLSLWDLAGDERYGMMTNVYYKNSMGVIIVFDLARVETIRNAIRWYYDAVKKYEQFGSKPCILFVGNKSDLQTVSKVEYMEILSSVLDKTLGCVEVSAKDDTEIIDCMETLLKAIEPCINTTKVKKDNEYISFSANPPETSGCCS